MQCIGYLSVQNNNDCRSRTHRLVRISYVARGNDGIIVGIGLACFLDRPSGDNTSLNDPTERYSDKVENIRCFINTLEDKVIRAVTLPLNGLDFSDLGPCAVVRQPPALLGVRLGPQRSPTSRNRALLKHNLPVAKQLGCEGAIAEATALASQKVSSRVFYHKRLNFQLIWPKKCFKK